MRLEFKAPAPAKPMDRGGWRQSIATTAQAAMVLNDLRPADGPIEIHGSFRMPRPKGTPKKVLHHQTRPDLLTLQHALLEGLKGIAFLETSQIVDIHVRKIFPQAEEPCVYITVVSA